MRWHNADGVSAEARAVIERHGLDMGRVLEWADYYEKKCGHDFNLAPLKDFKNAPVGLQLSKMTYMSPAFGRFRDAFNSALTRLTMARPMPSWTGCFGTVP